MIRGLHHAQITIPKGKEAQARAFYCDVLGLTEIPKPEALLARGGFWLDAGNLQVHVGVEDGVEREKTKAHVAYEVDDLAASRALIEAQGLEILEGIPIPGMDRFEFRDLFGNRVEFLQLRQI